MLSYKFDKATNESVLYTLSEHILDPMRLVIYYDDPQSKRLHHWITSPHNWNPVCWAGVIFAALCTISNQIERNGFVKYAHSSLLHFTDHSWTPDGLYEEGMGEELL